MKLTIWQKAVTVFFSAIVALVFHAATVSAGTFEMFRQLYSAGDKAWGQTPGPTTLAGIVAIAIKAFLGLLGIIFLVLIIYAGYEWMTAQGDEEKVTKAKDTLSRAVIGLIIIIAAYSITYFVFNALPGGGGGGGGIPIGGS